MSSPTRKDKYDSGSAQDVRAWIETVLNEQLPAGDIVETLKDGTTVCRLVNAIEPGSASFKVSKLPFVQMENISSFIRAAERIGVPHHELFETIDLYELRDPVQVIITLRSLSRHAHKKNPSIPVLGPKLLDPTQRKSQFAKQAEIPAWNTRQYGFLGGASQSTEGVVIGGRHDIVAPQFKAGPAAPNIIIGKSSPTSSRGSDSAVTASPSGANTSATTSPISIPLRTVSQKPSEVTGEQTRPTPFEIPKQTEKAAQPERTPRTLFEAEAREPTYETEPEFEIQLAAPIAAPSTRELPEVQTPQTPAVASPSRAVRPSPPVPPKPLNLHVRPTAHPRGPRAFGSSRPSAFNSFDDEEESETTGKTNVNGRVKVNTQLVAHGIKSSQIAAQAVEDEQDSSAFLYDEVYDAMKSAKSSAKTAVDGPDRKPKYVEKLLESKSIRERDRLRAQDALLRREREQEGDEFADKEMFVTAAYRAQQEELNKAKSEEAEREAKDKKRGGLGSFYSSLLERDEQQHEAVLQATTTSSGPERVTTEDDTPEGAVVRAERANRDAGYEKVQVNDNGELVDDRQLLSAGLNVKKSTSVPQQQPRRELQHAPKRQQNRSDNGSRRSATQHVEREIYTREKRRLQEEEDAKHEQLTQLKSRKTEDAISSARERYLARKRAEQNS